MEVKNTSPSKFGDRVGLEVFNKVNYTKMKNYFLTVALAVSLSAFSQFSWVEKEHVAIGAFLDGGTFDPNGVLGKVAFDGGLDFKYTNRIVSVHISSEHFYALEKYKDVMAAFGPTLQAGRHGQWEIFAGPRFGAVWRDSVIDETQHIRWNVGVEAEVMFWFNRDFGIFLHGNGTERNDQELRENDVNFVLSGRVGIRINLSPGKQGM